ncbi:MAG: DUF2232 domain-containing protein [Alphaproteobacteria bacterium]|nr:DUF2232 domain-containing protein [Alphaproteobacteria bacterium]
MKSIWLIAAGAGLASAVMFLAMMLGTMVALPLAYLAPLPLFLVGLSLGAGASALAGALSSAIVAAALGGSLLTGLVYFIVNGVPATILSRQALLGRDDGKGGIEWYPPGQLLGWLAGMALAALPGAVMLLSGVSGGLDAVMAGFSEEDLRRMLPANQLEQMRDLLKKVGTVVPGIIVISWMVMIAVNGALAQGLLARFGHNRRPRVDIATLELPEWLLLAAAFTALAAWFASDAVGFFARNGLAILMLPFLVLGLAVIHAFARQIKGGGFALGVVYLLLVLFSPLLVTIALLGVLDQLLGIRRRLAALPPT